MPPKQRPTVVVLSTRVATQTQRALQVQASGIFKLPIELFFEIFSYFSDHRQYIRDIYSFGGWYGDMKTYNVERSTVIRKLTMTCWALRDILLPVLWKDTEGCVVKPPTHNSPIRETYGLYAQCVYLLSNPAIAACVRTLSVDLSFKQGTPKDLMTKFVDTLVRLPNLRTLELLGVSHRSPVTRGLKRKCAQFPSIREMTVCCMYPDFIKSCPNLESLVFKGPFMGSYKDIGPYCARLKRVGGVDIAPGSNVESVLLCCPKLQEIALRGMIIHVNDEAVEYLRQAKHLTVVEVRLIEIPGVEYSRQQPYLLGKWKALKTGLVNVLKDSPSKDRKFLRWQFVQPDMSPDYKGFGFPYEVVETRELEVLSKSSA